MRPLSLKHRHWAERFHVLQFILGKVHWVGYNSLTQEELFLISATEAVLDECDNYDFVLTRKANLTKLANYIRIMNHCISLEKLTKKAQDLKPEGNFLVKRGLLPTSHEFFGWYKLFDIKRYVRKQSQKDNRQRARRRFIGVGYKDKGTMKNLAEDGTPSWQEVATAGNRQESISRKETDFRYKLLWTEWGYRQRE